MKEIIVATHNLGKLKEFNEILNVYGIKCLGLNDINYHEEIIEDGTTFKENALIKAKTIFNIYNKPVLADDSGLCIKALNNEPGIYSARYMNLDSFEEKMNYILTKLSTERSAFFNCTLCLYTSNKEYYFEGFLNGTIDTKLSGTNGFGYDPFFIPENFNISLANLPSETKNSISHRNDAIKKLIGFLNETNIF